MELRDYQEAAVSATYDFLAKNPGRNPCIVLPTGAGKTIVMAKICSDIVDNDGRVMVVAHVKELLTQAHSKLTTLGIDAGLYSASLGSRNIENDVIVASVQSVYQRGAELTGSIPFSAVIVDEAHRIPKSGDGMYRRLISDLLVCNPKTRVIGLTATPYRTDVGLVCSDDAILNDISFEVPVRDLIDQGYLSPLVGKGSNTQIDLSSVHIRGGEFVANEMEEAFTEGDKVRQAVEELRKLCANRSSVIIFCCGVAHAAAIKQLLDHFGESADVVVGDTASERRDNLVSDFKAKRLKYLVNVNCFCEGFDAPNVDAVVLLRATTSPGLYYQMVGRGLRVCEGKANCLVLDFGGNVQRHGAIDDIQIATKEQSEDGGGVLKKSPPLKKCPQCQRMNHSVMRFCVECGYEFHMEEARHEAFAGSESPLSVGGFEEHDVDEVIYSVHRKRGSDDIDPKTMRVTYMLQKIPVIDEWICVEHDGFAGEKAFAWWHRRSHEPMPRDAAKAVELANAGALAEPTKIRTRQKPGEKYARITRYELPDKKCLREPGIDDEVVAYKDIRDMQIPF